MDIRTLTIKERERLAYIGGHPDAKLLGGILAAQEERDAMETYLKASRTIWRTPWTGWGPNEHPSPQVSRKTA